MNPVDAVAEFLREQEIDCRHLLVAVSGGVDSTALMLALMELPDRSFTLTAGHVNHHLRGEESIEDEEWLREVCDRLGIPLRVAVGDVPEARIRERGLEAAAREVRYRELERLRSEAGADWIATAHQQNDQAETVLMRLISGSGVGRLGGIRPVTPERVMRPLLDVPREDLQDYLERKRIEPRRDSTNIDLRFVRNWVRWELLPLLEERNPRVRRALAETARDARDQARILADVLAARSAPWLHGDNQTVIPLADVPRDPALTRELLMREIRSLDPNGREISRESVSRIARSLPELKRTTLSGTLEILRRGDRIILRRLLPSGVAFEEPVTLDLPLELPMIDAVVRVQRYGGSLDGMTDPRRSRQLFQLPAGAEPRFVVRSRQPGDRFQPLGLRREKKLKEFLIDRKVPREDRDRLPLLTWKREIIWVGGVEVSERFKVESSDREIYEVSLIRVRDEEKLR